MFLFFIEMCGIRSGHLFTIEAENPRGADYVSKPFCRKIELLRFTDINKMLST